MPYLDEDILYNNVEEKYKSAKGKAREAYSDVLDTICEMPRADVVPKSEVERLEHILDCYALQYGTVKDQQEVIDKAKAEAAREIFEFLKLKAPFFCENQIAYDHFNEELAEIKRNMWRKNNEKQKLHLPEREKDRDR